MRLEDKLAAYLEYCEYRKELDRKTLKAYRIDLRQYFEYICVDEPDKEKIEEYVTHLHKSYKQKTVKRKIASIKAFYNYLEETEIIAESPFRKIKVKFKETVTLPRIIPREEIEKLLNHMYQCLNENDKASRKFMLKSTGVRPHKEKINISKEIINKTRRAVAPYAARMNYTPLRGEQ